MTYDISQVLDKLASSGKLNSNDKRWIARQINKEHERNLELKLMEVFARDPEMKYYIGMAGGAGVAWIGSMFGKAQVQEEPVEPEPGTVDIPWSWILGPVTGTFIDFTEGGGGLNENIGKILMLGGTGFAGSCAMILILRSIFSGTDLGELLSGVGEIVPL